MHDWKALKKDARTLAGIQLVRFEQGMSNNRRWQADEFCTLLVNHPWLTHLVKRVVWGVFDRSDVLLSTFRVTEDRTFANPSNEATELPERAIIGMVHPLLLDTTELQAWRTYFADRCIVQPFEQLHRETYELHDAERARRSLGHFAGRRVATSAVRGLVSLGWNLGEPQDAGLVHTVCKPIGPGLHAVLHLVDALLSITYGYDEPTLVLGDIIFGKITGWGDQIDQPLQPGAVRANIISEVMRDIDRLATVEELDDESQQVLPDGDTSRR